MSLKHHAQLVGDKNGDVTFNIGKQQVYGHHAVIRSLLRLTISLRCPLTLKKGVKGVKTKKGHHNVEVNDPIVTPALLQRVLAWSYSGLISRETFS